MAYMIKRYDYEDSFIDYVNAEQLVSIRVNTRFAKNKTNYFVGADSIVPNSDLIILSVKFNDKKDAFLELERIIRLINTGQPGQRTLEAFIAGMTSK